VLSCLAVIQDEEIGADIGRERNGGRFLYSDLGSEPGKGWDVGNRRRVEPRAGLGRGGLNSSGARLARSLDNDLSIHFGRDVDLAEQIAQQFQPPDRGKVDERRGVTDDDHGPSS